jgi:hypothetical protein
MPGDPPADIPAKPETEPFSSAIGETKSVIPAKAGIPRGQAMLLSHGTPACAGVTERCFARLPDKTKFKTRNAT